MAATFSYTYLRVSIPRSVQCSVAQSLLLSVLSLTDCHRMAAISSQRHRTRRHRSAQERQPASHRAHASDSDLAADLGFDSLQILEVVAELEDRFDISIPLNDVPAARTVGSGRRAGHRARRRRGDGLMDVATHAAGGACRGRSRAITATGSSARAAETRRSYADDVRRARSASPARSRALGLRRGDLVAIIVGDPEAFLTTLFGASIAGVVRRRSIRRRRRATCRVPRSDRPRCCDRAARAPSSRRDAPAAHRVAARDRVPDLSIVVAVRRAAGPAWTPSADRRRPTTSRSCSSRRDRRRRRKASSSRIAISSANIAAFAGPHGLDASATTSPSAGCRSITTWASSAWRSARCTRAPTRC